MPTPVRAEVRISVPCPPEQLWPFVRGLRAPVRLFRIDCAPAPTFTP